MHAKILAGFGQLSQDVGPTKKVASHPVSYIRLHSDFIEGLRTMGMAFGTIHHSVI